MGLLIKALRGNHGGNILPQTRNDVFIFGFNNDNNWGTDKKLFLRFTEDEITETYQIVSRIDVEFGA